MPRLAAAGAATVSCGALSSCAYFHSRSRRGAGCSGEDSLAAGADRDEAVRSGLNCGVRLLSSDTVRRAIPRKERRALALRCDALLDKLDSEAGEFSDWMSEGEAAVAATVDAILQLEEADGAQARPDAVVSAVQNLLQAVEAAASGAASSLRAALQSGGQHEAIAVVLEHGLTVLDAVSSSTPRGRQRKSVEALYESVEATLERIDSGFAQLLATCAEEQLDKLSQCLRAVEALQLNAFTPQRPGGAPENSAETIQALLAQLSQCSDLMAGAIELLASAEADHRMRGLGVLESLPHSFPPEPDSVSQAEIAVARVLTGMAGPSAGRYAERTLVYKALLRLGFRIGYEAGAVLASIPTMAGDEVLNLWFQYESGDISAGLTLGANYHVFGAFFCEAGPRCIGPARANFEKALSDYVKTAGAEHLQNVISRQTAADMHGLLPHLLALLRADDTVTAAGAMLWMFSSCNYLSADAASVLQTAEVYDALLEFWQKLDLSQKALGWWLQPERLLPNLTFALAFGPIGLCFGLCGLTGTVCFEHDLWQEMLSETVHLLKLNQQSDELPWIHLFDRLQMLYYMAATDHTIKARLVSEGVAERLLHTISQTQVFSGSTLAAWGALGAVLLIGTNERGLVLPREAVISVLSRLARHFDPSDRAWRYPITRMLPLTKALCLICISDHNKPFVLEHGSAIDVLAACLLLPTDAQDKRHAQFGREELQYSAAQALQNLALSPVSAPAIRAHTA